MYYRTIHTTNLNIIPVTQPLGFKVKIGESQFNGASMFSREVITTPHIVRVVAGVARAFDLTLITSTMVMGKFAATFWKYDVMNKLM